MSYNILAPSLALRHSSVQRGLLHMNFRLPRIVEEIMLHKPDVVCLQEVDSGRVQEYLTEELHACGYTGVYKKRTGDKVSTLQSTLGSSTCTPCLTCAASIGNDRVMAVQHSGEPQGASFSRVQSWNAQ